MWWIIALSVIGFIILAAAAVITFGNLRFARKTAAEVVDLFSTVKETKPPIVSEKDIEALPEPVQKYLRYTGIVGRENITSVRLKQKGTFKQANRPWMPFKAEQYYTTTPPAFSWITTMKAAPLLSVKGRDMYYQDKGNMFITIPPVVTIVDAHGPEINQGSLVRYLNEMMWFPSAYLCDYITWESIDANKARATITGGEIEASAVLYFDDEGKMTNFEALRYYMDGDTYSLETWTTPLTEYREFDGIRLPIKGEAVWKLDSGDFKYIQLELVDIEYNIPSLY